MTRIWPRDHSVFLCIVAFWAMALIDLMHTVLAWSMLSTANHNCMVKHEAEDYMSCIEEDIINVHR